MLSRMKWIVCLPLLAAGCSQVSTSDRVYDPQAIAAETYTVHSPAAVMPGMLVSDPEPLGDEAGVTGVMPWWYSRNDSRLGVRTGQRQVQVTDYVTYTDDQQQSSSAIQYDHYRRYSRTIRYGQIVH